MTHNIAGLTKYNVLVQIFCLLVVINVNLSLSLQTHRGSSQTNEFLLNARTPDAHIQVDSGNKNIIVINIKSPPLSPGQEAYKVGLQLRNMKLCDADDKLKVVYSDSTSIRNKIWKVNASGPTDPREQLVDIQANQIVLIPEGRWVLPSEVTLVATLYQDSMEDGDCPENTFPCYCTNIHENELTSRFSAEAPSASLSHQQAVQIHNLTDFQEPKIRCIPHILVCNGNPNCGLNCNDDEVQTACPDTTFTPPTSSSPLVSNCDPATTPPPATTENNGGSGSISRMLSSLTTIGIYAILTTLFNSI